MKLLLDTHAVLWWLDDDPRLGPEARDLIADPGHDVLVSVVSLWEMVVKLRVGKLKADIGRVTASIEQAGFVLVGIAPKHLTTLAKLPVHADHRDPFDHLLLAQAQAEGATLVSEDRNASRYPVRYVTCSGRTA